MRTFALTSLVLAFAGNALSQSQYYIDPASVTSADRQFWCQSQKTQCPLLCTQITDDSDASTRQNTCDPKTLEFSCVCGNGESPDLTKFSQTIPFFQCQRFGDNCVKACGTGNDDCAYNCRADNPCGAQDTEAPNSTAIASPTAAASTTSGADGADATDAPEEFTDFNGNNNNGDGNNNNGGNGGDEGAATTAMDLASSYGLAVVMSSLFAGFAIFL